MFNMKIVVTIPAYNEGGSIAKVIADIRQVMNSMHYSYEIIVVDDGSTDKTAQTAKKAGAFVFSHQFNFGLAEAFRTEMKVALEKNADIIIHTDADGQYLAKDVPKLLAPILNKKADLVLGSRFLGKIEHMPFMKRFGNKSFSLVLSHITKMKITDGQTGFRAFTRKFAESIKIISSHTYTQEMIIRAVKEKFRVVEVPVYFAKRKKGKSKLISNKFGLDYALKGWINILRVYRDYKPLKFFGSIGLFLMFISFIIASYIAYEFILFGLPVFEQRIPTLLLMLLFFLTGLQIMLFGFLADKNNR